MLGWLRSIGRHGGRVVYQVPPRELPASVLAEREYEVGQLDAAIDEARLYGERDVVDRLLDARNAIRPPRCES